MARREDLRMLPDINEHGNSTKKLKPSLVIQTNVSRHRGQVPELKSIGRPERSSGIRKASMQSTSSRVFHSRDDVERRLSMKRRRLPLYPTKEPGTRYLKPRRQSVTSRNSKAASQSGSDYLSPSEGGIFIGLAVPSKTLAEFDNRGRSEERNTKLERSPITPSIVVTPADDEYTPSRYSATSFRHDSFMPPLPDGNILEEQREKFRREMENRLSTTSNYTDISNSPMPEFNVPQSADPMTAATVSSVGWWNYVLSPAGTIAPPLPQTPEMSEKLGSPSLTLEKRNEHNHLRDSAWTDAIEWDSPVTAYTTDERPPDIPIFVQTPPERFPPSLYPPSFQSQRELPSLPSQPNPSTSSKKEFVPLIFTLPSHPGPSTKQYPPSFYPQRQVPASGGPKLIPLPTNPSPKLAPPPGPSRPEPATASEKGNVAVAPVEHMVYHTITLNSRVDSLPAYSTSGDVAGLDNKAAKKEGKASSSKAIFQRKATPPPPSDSESDEDDFLYTDEKTPILERAAAVGVTNFSKDKQKGKATANVSSPEPPPYSSPPKPKTVPRNIVTAIPAQMPPSPAPITPAVVSALESTRNYAMKELPRQPNHDDDKIEPLPLPTDVRAPPVTLSVFMDQDKDKLRAKIEQKRQAKEKREAFLLRLANCWRGRGPRSNKPRNTQKLRACFWFSLGIIMIIIIAVVVGVVLGKRAKNRPNPTQIQFNTTIVGFPTIPIGNFVVLQPQISAVGACIVPNTLWSCAAPPDISRPANRPQNQPDIQFRVEKFASSRLFKRADPQPPAPPIAEQEFLGKTTDENNGPLFSGKETPFSISFTHPNLAKRDLFTTPNSDAPSFGVGTQPASPNLLPTSGFNYQPLRLYNENTESEHYGFYNYFDRSQFASGLQPDQGESDNGGVPPGQATRQLLWRNMRLRVQIWTRLNATILTNANSQAIDAAGKTNLTLPVTMRFPVTITLDRHGKVNNQSLAGYELAGGTYLTGKGVIVKENFAASGNVNTTGGLVGGSGGCSCTWNNFAS